MSDLAAEKPAPKLFFDAVLSPHRSLPPSGFALVMALLGAVSFAAGIGFVLLGAWPVCGFFGVDVALVYLAFRASYKSARQHEILRLSESDFDVERVSVYGERRHWRFQPFWLRIVFEEKSSEENRLTLASHGRSVVLGSFLGPAERRSLAAALKAALADWRDAVAAASETTCP